MLVMSIKLLRPHATQKKEHTENNNNNIYEQNEIRSCYLCTKPFQLRNYQ